MNKTVRRLAGALIVAALVTLALPGRLDALAHVSPPPAAAVECEGTACQQLTLTFDEARQQYRAKNNSSDRWVKVTASNLAAAAGACLAPGATEYLPLKSIVSPYRAEFDEPRCGAPDSNETPPAP